MANKFYAVKVGKKTGVYATWDECKANVHGYKGAVYKSFPTFEEAAAFANCDDNTSRIAANDIAGNDIGETKIGEDSYAFVDGSYNQATKVYGFGGFLIHNNDKFVVSGCGDDEEMASMRNVAGEVLGSMAAIKLAIEKGIKELTIYYDYMGIEMWATGAWKRNKKGTIEYYDFIKSIENTIKLNFVKVKGHSGVEGNEEADLLAKKAVGIV